MFFHECLLCLVDGCWNDLYDAGICRICNSEPFGLVFKAAWIVALTFVMIGCDSFLSGVQMIPQIRKIKKKGIPIVRKLEIL